MRRGLLLVALAAVTWGTTGTTLKLIGDPSPVAPLLVGAARMLVAGLLLLAAAWLAHQPVKVGRTSLLAGVCIAAYQIGYFSAVPLAGVAPTALLAICSAPLLIALLGRLLLGERFTPRRLLALVLGVIGAALLVAGAGQGLAGPRFISGAALALGAGLSYSVYAVLTRRAMLATAGGPHTAGVVSASELPTASGPLALAAVTFSVAAVALLPTLAIDPGEAGALLAHGWLYLVYLGAVPTALAYAMYTAALRAVPAGSAAIVGLLEPLTATVLGTLLFGEALGPVGLLGGLLLVAAVAILAWR